MRGCQDRAAIAKGCSKHLCLPVCRPKRKFGQQLPAYPGRHWPTQLREGTRAVREPMREQKATAAAPTPGCPCAIIQPHRAIEATPPTVPWIENPVPAPPPFVATNPHFPFLAPPPT